MLLEPLNEVQQETLRARRLFVERNCARDRLQAALVRYSHGTVFSLDILFVDFRF
jgi:hypothetical protein